VWGRGRSSGRWEKTWKRLKNILKFKLYEFFLISYN
jgi:hypothetical protein